jgi:hypothetical protein
VSERSDVDLRLRDITDNGSPDDYAAHVEDVCAKCEVLANSLGRKTSLGEAARVLPNLLRCVARQLRISVAAIDLPIEVAAGCCRTVYELNLCVRLLTNDPSQIQSLSVERVFDEIDMLNGLMKLAEEGNPAVAGIEQRLQVLLEFVDKWKLKKPARAHVATMAKLAHVPDEHDALYRFYSKYVHGSAWLVNASDEERDGEAFRKVFQVQTQKYAFNSYERIYQFALSS